MEAVFLTPYVYLKDWSTVQKYNLQSKATLERVLSDFPLLVETAIVYWGQLVSDDVMWPVEKDVMYELH